MENRSLKPMVAVPRLPRPGRVASAAAIALAAASILAACGSGATQAKSAAQWAKSGRVAQRAGHYAIAISDYKAALKINPSDVYTLYDLGDAQQFMGDVADAQTNYAAVLSLASLTGPNRGLVETTMYNLAIIDLKSDPAAAKSLLSRVVAISPNDGPARMDLGKALLALGERAAAQVQVAKAIQLDPSLRSVAPKF